MSNNDRSNEALLARRAKAEAATPGPWEHRRKRFYGDEEETAYVAANSHILLLANPGTDEHNIAFCAANSPDVVMADIDEILRLRAEVARLEREADFLASNIYSSHSCFDCPFYRQETGDCTWHEKPWREDARKAVEKQCQK